MSLMKTEVVLKFKDYPYALQHELFNENRSCIEILDLALNDYLQNFLMEIEVVYKIYVYLYL